MIIRKNFKRDCGENDDRLLSKDYVLVMLGATGQLLMNHFFLAAMPLYINKLGGTTLQAGMIMTVYALVALVMRPVSGILSDKFGRVKLMVAGTLICAVTCVLLGMVSFFPLLMVIRALNGAGFGLLSTCAGAAVADIVPKHRLTEGIGIYGMYNTIAQAVGPGIALALIAGDAISDYRRMFYITAVLCAVSAFANGGVSYERRRKKQAGSYSDEASAINEQSMDVTGSEPLPKAIFGFEYAVFAPVAVMMVLYFGIAGLMSFMSPFARWKGIDNPGLYYAVSAAGIFFSRVVFGKIADKRGMDIVIIPGMAVLAVCLALLPSINSLAALAALALPIGISQGAVVPTFNSMLFRRCSPARRGTASGAYFVAIDLGFAIGAPLLGALADAKDYGYIFFAAALFVALALILYLLIASEKRYNAS